MWRGNSARLPASMLTQAPRFPASAAYTGSIGSAGAVVREPQQPYEPSPEMGSAAGQIVVRSGRALSDAVADRCRSHHTAWSCSPLMPTACRAPRRFSATGEHGCANSRIGSRTPAHGRDHPHDGWTAVFGATSCGTKLGESTAQHALPGLSIRGTRSRGDAVQTPRSHFRCTFVGNAPRRST
jgi:hypothetical protein